MKIELDNKINLILIVAVLLLGYMLINNNNGIKKITNQYTELQKLNNRLSQQNAEYLKKITDIDTKVGQINAEIAEIDKNIILQKNEIAKNNKKTQNELANLRNANSEQLSAIFSKYDTSLKPIVLVPEK